MSSSESADKMANPELELMTMDMPSMSGVKLNMSKLSHGVSQSLAHNRRGSMFDAQPRSFIGKIETYSRGSMSLKGVVDPAIHLSDKSQETSGSESNSNVRVSRLTNIPPEMVHHIESKETIDSQAERKKKLEPQFENTYRTDPIRKPTKKELTGLLTEILSGYSDDPSEYKAFDKCIKLGQQIANRVREDCHSLDLNRYKFLVNSTVIQPVSTGTSAQMVSRSLWDDKRDTWVEERLKLPGADIFIQLYCVYLD